MEEVISDMQKRTRLEVTGWSEDGLLPNVPGDLEYLRTASADYPQLPGHCFTADMGLPWSEVRKALLADRQGEPIRGVIYTTLELAADGGLERWGVELVITKGCADALDEIEAQMEFVKPLPTENVFGIIIGSLTNKTLQGLLDPGTARMVDSELDGEYVPAVIALTRHLWERIHV